MRSPTDNQLVRKISEGSKRILSKPVSKKEPITVDILQKMYMKLFDRNSLYNQRTICICLLSFAGFLRNKELINIKRSDVITLKYLSNSVKQMYTETVPGLLPQECLLICVQSVILKYILI